MQKNNKIPLNVLFKANGVPSLEEEISACKDKCYRYNLLHPNDTENRRALLREIFAEVGEGAAVMPPFWCDYGSHIRIGKNFYANHNLVITDGADVTIGDDVFIAPNCCITTAEHALDPEQRKAGMEVAKPVTIGNNVWLGAGAIVLAGVTIGDNTVVGARSVVTKDIPAGVVATGVPCRVRRKISEEDKHRYPLANRNGIMF